MRRFPTISPGAAGASLGLLVGLLFTLPWMFQDRDLPGFPAPAHASTPRSADGRVLVMGEAPDDAAPEDLLRPRALALARVAQSEVLLGTVVGAVETLKKIAEDDQRDVALHWTINKLLQEKDAPSIFEIEDLRLLSEQFKDKNRHAMLYARLADIRAKLPKAEATKSPTVAELLKQAKQIAESIAPDPVERWHLAKVLWGVIATGTFSFAGFLGSTLLSSALGEIGKGMATGMIEAGKHLHGNGTGPAVHLVATNDRGPEARTAGGPHQA